MQKPSSCSTYVQGQQPLLYSLHSELVLAGHVTELLENLPLSVENRSIAIIPSCFSALLHQAQKRISN